MSSSNTDVPEFATLQEAAALLRVSERKLWSMGKRGVIRRHVDGRCVRYLTREYVERARGTNGKRD